MQYQRTIFGTCGVSRIDRHEMCRVPGDRIGPPFLALPIPGENITAATGWL